VTNEAIVVLAYLFFSLVIFWKSIIAMIEKRTIARFLPFFAVGILMCFNAALVFYMIIDVFWWSVFGVSYLAIIIWITAMVVKRYHDG
jgi:hypothetical protein